MHVHPLRAGSKQANAPPSEPDFAADVRAGLARAPRTLPSKYLYDAAGSALFDAITALPEYGLFRAEERILKSHASEIAASLPHGLAVAELGAGSGHKTVHVLDALLDRQRVVDYSAIDVSRAAQRRCAARVSRRLGIRFHAVVASFLDGLARVTSRRVPGEPLLVLFLGSTIGNLDESEQRSFLRGVRAQLREGDALLLGADLRKPVELLIAAYDDAAGLTAAFDRNLLRRINRELGGNFDPHAFRHEARWSERFGRIEMHLRSLREQVVKIPAAGVRMTVGAGETIWTESSHKYDLAALTALAVSSGFHFVAHWADESWPFVDALWIAGRGDA